MSDIGGAPKKKRSNTVLSMLKQPISPYAIGHQLSHFLPLKFYTATIVLLVFQCCFYYIKYAMQGV